MPSANLGRVVGPQGPQGPRGSDAVGAVVFTIDENGHLIMHSSNVELDNNIFLVNNDPSSPSYYETLGVPSSLIGHLVFIYQ